ncbi:MAG: hypothetical protein KAT65_11365 [Methanophagales archaeon]|nr:hypothetical protein [Methanophagales archaeon]
MERKKEKAVFKVSRVSVSEKTTHTYIALENDKGETAGTLTLRGKHEQLVGAKEVKVLGSE